MADVGNIVISLNAKTEQFNRAMEAASKKTAALSGTLKSFGKGLSMGVTLPLAAAGTAAVHFANKMNKEMANVGSLGVGVESLERLKRDMQDTAIMVGGSTTDMAQGLYQVVSAFGHTAESSKILEINAKAAKAGLTDVSNAVALTSAVTKGYGDTSAEAVQKVADLAFKTVEMGQTDFPQLSNSIMRVTSLSENMGISQEELFASFATLTGVTGDAARVSTQYQGALQGLMSPSEGMTKLLKQHGFESGKAAIESLGFQETLALVAEHAEATGEPLQKYIGSIEGQVFATAMAGKQSGEYIKRLDAMGESMGAADAALAAQTTGMNAVGFMMDQVGTKFSVLAERIGDVLIPVVGGLIDIGTPLIDWAIEMVDWFGTLKTPIKIVAGTIVGLVAAIGPLMASVGVLLPLISQMGVGLKLLAPLFAPLISGIMAISAPVWLTIGAFAALGAAFYYFGDEIISGVATSIDLFVDVVLNNMIKGVNWATTQLNEAFGLGIPQMELFATSGETMGSRFSGSMHGMKDSIGQWVEGMVLAEEPLVEFQEGIEKTGEVIAEASDKIMKPILELPEAIEDAEIEDKMKVAVDPIKELGEKTFNSMKNHVKKMDLSFGSFKKTLKAVGSEFKGFFKELLKMAAKKAVMKLIDTLTGGTGIGGGVAGFGMGMLGKLGGMFGFAKGGIITEPTAMMGLRSGGMGIMGEAGPEAIVPLGGRRGGGGVALTVNVYGSVGVEDIGERLVRTLRTRGIT